MPTVRLTELSIRQLKPKAKQIEYFDKGFNPGVSGGLGLRVSPGGKKSWFITYRLKDGTKSTLQKFRIGSYPDMNLKDARKTAADVLAKVDRGGNPKEAQQAVREAPTFQDIADVYMKYHARRHKRPASIREDQRILDKELIPKWGHRKAKSIARSDAIALLDDIAKDAPVMANRVLALASTIFNVAIDRELIESNPCYRLKKPGGKEKSRKRVLKPEEIKALWDALPSLTPLMTAIFKIRLLTGQRGKEVCSMQWTDIDLDEAVWTIPETVTKNKIAHRVPLTKPVLDILEVLPHESEWIFPASPGSSVDHIANVQKTARKLRNESGVDDFRLHDLRRTVATLMAEMGVSEFVVGKVLNHSNGKNVTAVYNRYAYDAEKRIALEKWANRLAQIVGGEEAKVYHLTR